MKFILIVSFLMFAVQSQAKSLPKHEVEKLKPDLQNWDKWKCFAGEGYRVVKKYSEGVYVITDVYFNNGHSVVVKSKEQHLLKTTRNISKPGLYDKFVAEMLGKQTVEMMNGFKKKVEVMKESPRCKVILDKINRVKKKYGMK